MIKNKRLRLKANDFLSSILVLITCLIFIQFYLDVYQESMENDFLLIEYLINN